MGNLIWTGIIYFCTIAIVFVTFRAFVEDGKEDNASRTQLLFQRTAKAAEEVTPAARRQVRAGAKR